MSSIGITGIIGSGKTIICKIFEIMNIPVYNADANAKKLMLADVSIKKNLTKYFGSEVYLNGELNKAFLSNKIFNSEKHRKFVNSVVHPVVIQDFLAWKCLHKHEIVAIESALLYEAKIDKIVDHVILVQSPPNILLQRIVERDKISETEAYKRIDAQRKNIPAQTDGSFEILNDEKSSLIEQCLKILDLIKQTI